MRRQLVALAILVSLGVTTVAGGMQSPTVFKKVDFFIHTGDEVDDRDAQLILDPQRRVIIVADEDHASQVFATVEWNRITGVTYENSKRARITATASPLLHAVRTRINKTDFAARRLGHRFRRTAGQPISPRRRAGRICGA